MKTIRMPKELLAKWLAALRSGEFSQTRGTMKDQDGYCCLGVLVAVGDSEDKDLELKGGVPSELFRERNGVSFVTQMPHERRGDDFHTASDGNPYLPALNDFAAGANDSGATFAQIADAIEACAEGI